jgi:hypothetical protein
VLTILNLVIEKRKGNSRCTQANNEEEAKASIRMFYIRLMKIYTRSLNLSGMFFDVFEVN